MIRTRHLPGRIAACLLACLLAACEDGSPVAPPMIHYGQDVCRVCNMIVSDERYAAGLVAEVSGDARESRSFDDIGCMLADGSTLPDEAVLARYVHDFQTGRWLDAETATYVHSPELVSPMAFGLAACASEADPRGLLADHPGRVLDFEVLRTGFEAGELAIDPRQTPDAPAAPPVFEPDVSTGVTSAPHSPPPPAPPAQARPEEGAP
ncbi:MAG: nitrous oxide reductase accessory protein NosL [Planctomycetota bacterium]|jgi:copper chaperone NosL